MIIHYYCPLCKNTYLQEIKFSHQDQKSNEHDLEKSNSITEETSIPSPSRNGILSVAIIHGDHVVILDLDEQGVVRSISPYMVVNIL